MALTIAGIEREIAIQEHRVQNAIQFAADRVAEYQKARPNICSQGLAEQLAHNLSADCITIAREAAELKILQGVLRLLDE